MLDLPKIQSSSTARWLAALVAAMLLVVSATAPAAAAQHTDNKAFVVELQEDGSATVTIQLAYDLNSEEERQAFRELEENDTLQQQYRSSFENRMQGVATSAADAAGRDMSVSNPQISFETRDSGATGVVSLSVDWTGLAATTDDGLVITEPFAGDYEPNRTFSVRGPDGYQLASATPAPDQKDGNAVSWQTETGLDGFQATFTPAETDTATPTDTGVSTPGFGIVAALTALLAVALLVRRRR